MLNDFRDRVGDARYGKPTLLLRFGKTTTCVASLCALVAGDLVLVVALEPVISAFVQIFTVAIAVMLWTLWRADGQIAEQVAIGIGARMGNGLLLCVLGWLLFEGNGAPVAQAALFTAFLSAPFFLSFVSLATRPGEAVIGGKG